METFLTEENSGIHGSGKTERVESFTEVTAILFALFVMARESHYQYLDYADSAKSHSLIENISLPLTKKMLCFYKEIGTQT